MAEQATAACLSTAEQANTLDKLIAEFKLDSSDGNCGSTRAA